MRSYRHIYRVDAADGKLTPTTSYTRDTNVPQETKREREREETYSVFLNQDEEETISALLERTERKTGE